MARPSSIIIPGPFQSVAAVPVAAVEAPARGATPWDGRSQHRMVPGGMLRLDLRFEQVEHEAAGKAEVKLQENILRVVKIVNDGQSAILETMERGKGWPRIRLLVTARPIQD